MTSETEPTTSKITNDEKVEVNETVNKKLSTMSKEAKTRKKRKLQKPPKNETGPVMNNNQTFLILTMAGVIIAGLSLYYQRKSVMKNEKHKEPEVPEVKLISPQDDNDLFTF